MPRALVRVIVAAARGIAVASVFVMVVGCDGGVVVVAAIVPVGVAVIAGGCGGRR